MRRMVAQKETETKRIRVLMRNATGDEGMKKRTETRVEKARGTGTGG